jgi:hypothetical protein
MKETTSNPKVLPNPGLGRESVRGEVPACPTGLSDLMPSVPEGDALAEPPLEVERLPERDEEAKLDEDVAPPLSDSIGKAQGE